VSCSVFSGFVFPILPSLLGRNTYNILKGLPVGVAYATISQSLLNELKTIVIGCVT